MTIVQEYVGLFALSTISFCSDVALRTVEIKCVVNTVDTLCTQ